MSNKRRFPDWMSNRQKKKERKPTHSSYCWGCDANTVNDGQKCSICGVRQEPRRNKKNGKLE